MATLQLDVLTPNGLAFEKEVSYVSLPSSKGVLGILPNHTPFIGQLAPKGLMKIVHTDGHEEYMVISNGAIEIKKEKTIVLTEKAIKVSSEEEGKNLLKEMGK